MGYSLRLTWDVQTISTFGIVLFSEVAFGERAADLAQTPADLSICGCLSLIVIPDRWSDLATFLFVRHSTGTRKIGTIPVVRTSDVSGTKDNYISA
jgi:hypothetical protein